jgi:1,4-dihydroxy-2-naphthoyl-CoA hydrolase
MDGIRMLEERLKGLFPDLLGMQFVEAAPELVRASLQVRPELCTVGGILHGGAIMAFADTLGAVATILNLPPDARTATIESKTNFLRPAPAGSQVLGECTALHRGKTFMTWQTRVTTEDGKLVAFVVQTQAVLS